MMEFQEIGANCFVITFANQGDRKRILDGCPWLFDNYLFAFKVFDGSSQPNMLDFSTEKFWIQMYNLPLGGMTRCMGELIGNSIGKVWDVDVQEDNMAWGRCLRVKVECDLMKKVARGRTIMYEGKSMWIPFKYEKLPKICFKCGCMTHGKLGCQGGDNQGESQQFGSWLRAPADNLKKIGRKSMHYQQDNASEQAYASKEGSDVQGAVIVASNGRGEEIENVTKAGRDVEAMERSKE